VPAWITRFPSRSIRPTLFVALPQALGSRPETSKGLEIDGKPDDLSGPCPRAEVWFIEPGAVPEITFPDLLGDRVVVRSRHPSQHAAAGDGNLEGFFASNWAAPVPPPAETPAEKGSDFQFLDLWFSGSQPPCLGALDPPPPTGRPKERRRFDVLNLPDLSVMPLGILTVNSCAFAG